MNTKVLDEVVRRIVEVARPEKVILFGSAARDETNIHSDLDVLVVTSGPVHRGRLTEEIYLNLFGVGSAVDVVVVTPEDVESYRDDPYLVVEPALREGRVVYERQGGSHLSWSKVPVQS
jgi:predicted nucleotidyltransferase